MFILSHIQHQNLVIKVGTGQGKKVLKPPCVILLILISELRFTFEKVFSPIVGQNAEITVEITSYRK